MLKMIIAGLMLISGLNLWAVAQDTRGSVKVKYADRNTSETLYEGSYALVIGVSDYTNGWDKLPGVKSDVEAVKAELEKHKFNVETLLNPTERELDNKIHQFIKLKGIDFDNRLLIYFAGHGYTETIQNRREMGYIVPVDAALPQNDLNGFRQKAVSMDTIQNYARQIFSKHALFIFDSCFSGSLVSRGRGIVPPRIIEEVKNPVRQFITAGAANQTVPDESIFRRFFIRGLEGEADRNKDGYILGSELADYLKDKVIEYSNETQTPQYGKIRDLNLDQGDFVFVVPSTENGQPAPDPRVQQITSGTFAGNVHLRQGDGRFFSSTFDQTNNKGLSVWSLQPGKHNNLTGYWICKTIERKCWQAVNTNGPLQYWNEDGRARGTPEDWELFVFEMVDPASNTVRVKNVHGRYVRYDGSRFVCDTDQSNAAIFTLEF
jgi:hypothetical protein